MGVSAAGATSDRTMSAVHCPAEQPSLAARRPNALIVIFPWGHLNETENTAG